MFHKHKKTAPYQTKHYKSFWVVVLGFFFVALSVVLFYETKIFLSVKQAMNVEVLPVVESDQGVLTLFSAALDRAQQAVSMRKEARKKQIPVTLPKVESIPDPSSQKVEPVI